LLASWGGWNLLVLHGRHSFCKHWLNWTGIAIFSVRQNPDGDNILQNDLYGRILLIMVAVGAITALKRTMVALFLSKRMLSNYKDQMEHIMNQVQLIAGLAELAAETDKPGFDKLLLSIQQQDDENDDDDDENENNEDDNNKNTVHDDEVSLASQVHLEGNSNYMAEVPTFSSSAYPFQSNDNKNDTESDDDMNQTSQAEQWQEIKEQALRDDEQKKQKMSRKSIGTTTTTPTTLFEQVMATLDRYDTPHYIKTSQDESTSLFDILQFKKVSTFMRDPYPFTQVFGPAQNRRDCVRSAIRVYQKLQRFSPESVADDDDLNFDVIGALAYREDGILDKKRAQGMLRLFVPDSNNRISLNAFVSSCDSVLRQIIFLNASMTNSSKIDSVLEQNFNGLFFAVISFLIMSVLGLDLWPLLVSLSTMLLSLAFALGPSCAKTIEGILAIAVRRPFDLGDRIILSTGLATSTPDSSDTWIVEDINLTTTTLRLAATNEVSTINNSSLSDARIVNCARSPKAIIRFRMVFHSEAPRDKLDDYQKHMEKYVRDRPRIWTRLVQFANDGIDSSDGYITYKIGVEHVASWQELGKIVRHRGELQRDALYIARELKIDYRTPETQTNVELVSKTTNVS